MLAAVLVVFSAGAVLLSETGSESEAADSEQTANYSITGDETSVKPSGELKFDMTFKEISSYTTLSISYTAKLTNSSGTTQSSAVSPSSGDMDNGEVVTLTVTAPTTTGRYTLTVTWTESIDGGSDMTYTDSVDINTTVYFFVDGEKIEDSATTLKVSPGSSSTISYKYYSSNLSHGQHSFYVATSDGSIVLEKSTFYYEDGNYDWLNYVMAIIFIIVVIAFIYVVRKPVKNYGKPKARR